jgi:hypothetical protein
VTVVDRGIGAITDAAGRYRIDAVDDGPAELVFVYASIRREYPIVVDGPISFDAQLDHGTGAIQGVVKDQTGYALPGVTVIASSPSQTQTAITDDNGFYKLSELPPDDYDVEFYFADIHIDRDHIHVGIDKTVPVYQTIDMTGSGGDPIHVENSTSEGITIDKDYLKNIPVPGRTFEAALGAAAGSQGVEGGE